MYYFNQYRKHKICYFVKLISISFLYIKKKSIIETIVEIIRGDKYDNVDNKSFF